MDLSQELTVFEDEIGAASVEPLINGEDQCVKIL